MRVLLLICWLVVVHWAQAQEYNYVRYDTRDGLAGSTVYDVVQDKDGFIWFATENGLSRFDGKYFKNYTVKDGLPDNEVLTLFADSKGRVWMGTFSKQLCYISKGKIHNAQNDTLLSKVVWNADISKIVESNAGELFVSDQRSLYKLDQHNRWQNLTAHAMFQPHPFKRLNMGHPSRPPPRSWG